MEITVSVNKKDGVYFATHKTLTVSHSSLTGLKQSFVKLYSKNHPGEHVFNFKHIYRLTFKW